SSGISELRWAAGNEGTAFFATGGEAIVGNEFTVTANGTYTVYARDNAGNEAVETITISNIVRSTSSGDSTPPDSPEDSDPRTIISIGPGVIIIEVAPRDIKELPKDNGGNKKVVNLPDDVWDGIPKLLDDDHPVIRVIIDDHLPDVELHLPGKRLAELWDINPNVEFDMQLNGSSFQLKVNVLDLEQLATRLGIAVDEMNVIIKISALTGETKEDFILAADEQGMTLLSQVIEFQLFVSGGDEWVEITDFGGTYMTKSIMLDEQFANRNYMAVLYDPDGRTFTYVPAIMASRSNGQQDSVIQMPHNSIYAVVETDRIEFADMQGHWAESEVEQLGSKRFVKGITINDYAPNRNITRAEFASLLVRALGIKTDRTGAGDVFKDVAITSWYSTEVEAAFRAGLVNGISSTHFAPEAQITREQIALMLMNAHALVKEEFNSIEQIPNSLTLFTDASEVSAWARAAMSEAVASKLIQGMSTDRLAPTASATRAQAAVMLHRLMVMIEFLD
ncbi:S-layer homology domain-containing protein, partial [Paenibacillus eucommiae]